MPPGIVAFAKDWSEDPTSNHHVLRELARTRRVLWLNSVATRTPKLTSGRDLGKIRRKLGEFTRGPVRVENDLWVFSPLVLPLPHSPWARAINQQILRATIRGLRWRLGLGEFQLWTFLPNVADYVGTLGETLAVYYCVDEWSMFSYVDRAHTVAAERALLGKVDCVFAINHALADAKRAIHAETHVSPHGVDHAAFARALESGDGRACRSRRAAAADHRLLRHGPGLGRPRPRRRGRARPASQWTFVPHRSGARRREARSPGSPTCTCSAAAPTPELPAYCKGFDVGWIPYRIDERMTVRQTRSSCASTCRPGCPWVSTAVARGGPPRRSPRRPRTRARFASDAATTITAIERALAADTPARRRERSAAMATETWTARVDTVAKIVDDVARRRRATAGGQT